VTGLRIKKESSRFWKFVLAYESFFGVEPEKEKTSHTINLVQTSANLQLIREILYNPIILKKPLPFILHRRFVPFISYSFPNVRRSRSGLESGHYSSNAMCHNIGYRIKQDQELDQVAATRSTGGPTTFHPS